VARRGKQGRGQVTLKLVEPMQDMRVSQLHTNHAMASCKVFTKTWHIRHVCPGTSCSSLYLLASFKLHGAYDAARTCTARACLGR